MSIDPVFPVNLGYARRPYVFQTGTTIGGKGNLGQDMGMNVIGIKENSCMGEETEVLIPWLQYS